MSGQVEWECVRVPRSTDRSRVVTGNLDRPERIEINREWRGRECRRGNQIKAGQDILNLEKTIRSCELSLCRSTAL